MGYDIRHVLVTFIVIDFIPTSRKRLRIDRNRHWSRAQDPLDEEDVVACVAPCRWRCGSLSLSSPPPARQGHHRDAIKAKLSRHAVAATGRWQLTGIIGRVEASEDHVPF